MADPRTPLDRPPYGMYLMLTFKVTDGEQGHPMDHITTRLDLADDGTMLGSSVDEVVSLLRAEVARRVRIRG